MTATTQSINGSPTRSGTDAQPPTAELPYWRGPGGRRTGFSELAAGRDADQVAELSELHVQAISALLGAGFAARAGGDDAETRRCFANAARLCNEPVGHWPVAAMCSDH